VVSQSIGSLSDGNHVGVSDVGRGFDKQSNGRKQSGGGHKKLSLIVIGGDEFGR
jgi:hypothetical protein